MKFQLEQSDEFLTAHSGLILPGLLMAQTDLNEELNKTKIPNNLSPHISNANVVVSYLGLLCQGKSDFDQIEVFREDIF